MRGRDKFRKHKLLITFLCYIYSLFPRKFRIILFENYRMTQGSKGLLIRYVLLKTVAINCGENVSIHPGVYLLKPENVKIGNHVSIHPMCYIDASGGLEIGSSVSIAHGVTIMSTEHRHENIDIPIKDQGVDSHTTSIKDNVWIGAKSTILAGITVDEGSIIAAGAVITKDTAKNTIVGGVPGKVLKGRH